MPARPAVVDADDKGADDDQEEEGEVEGRGGRVQVVHAHFGVEMGEADERTEVGGCGRCKLSLEWRGK